MLKSRYAKICLCAFLGAAVAAVVPGFADSAEKYNSYGRRDPFVPLVGVADTVTRGGIEGIASIQDVDLQGIVVSANGQKGVIMNGEVIGEGEIAGRIKIESVGSNTVVLRIDNELHEMKLYR